MCRRIDGGTHGPRRKGKLKSLRLIITASAKEDLKGIHDYIAEQSPEIARRFTRELVDELFRLAQSGRTGSPREWISPGLRGHLYRKRCIYLRIQDDAMLVVRILHCHQDVEAQVFPEP